MTATTQPARALRSPAQDPGQLRLRMADSLADHRLDGAWWPRSRDIERELADLVDHFPADRYGRVVRVSVSRSDWVTQSRHVLVRSGYVKIGSLTDDSNVIHLTTSDRTLLRLLVVPHTFTRLQGDEALRFASRDGSRGSASALIQQVARGWETDYERPRAPHRRLASWTADPPTTPASIRG